MNHFDLKNGELHCEDVPLSAIADQVGTPTYVYSTATLTRHFRVFDEALANVKHLICYSVKANSNLAILKLLANLGSGFDIVSGGELHRIQAAGIPTDRVVFSGVGKTEPELRAALRARIRCFNVESRGELHLLSRVAVEEGIEAPISIRVNPNVDAQTHPYISTGLKGNKFGVAWDCALAVYQDAKMLPGLNVVGVDCHIGSQLLRLAPMLEALELMLGLVAELRARGHNIQHLDMGGGLGIAYNKETPPTPHEFAQAFAQRTAGHGLTLVFEPGRVLVGNAGVMLTRVLYTKTNGQKNFVVVDGAMNDLLRPSLYDAWHDLVPVVPRNTAAPTTEVDVVGPICESGDFLAKQRAMPLLAPGELICAMSAGAYGFSMASNYNSRCKAAEVLVHGDQFTVIRQREALDDLTRGEHIPPHLIWRRDQPKTLP